MLGVAVVAKKKPSTELAECSSCGARIPEDAKECPECGEVFSEELLEAVGDSAKARKRERLMFYLGIIFILVGGPGLALGSVLHDVLKIPVLGKAYYEFGWVNRMFAAIGLVVLIVGVVFMILSSKMASKSPDDDYDVGVLKSA